MTDYKLVPVEPTADMVMAGEDAWDAQLEKRIFAKEDGEPFAAYPSEETHELCSRVAYRAMLAAAPAVQVEPESSGLHAVYLRDNWDGEGDTYWILARKQDNGVWVSDDSGKELIEHEGDALLKVVPLVAAPQSAEQQDNVPEGWRSRFLKLMGEIQSELDGSNDDPIPSELWSLWRELLDTAPQPAEQQPEPISRNLRAVHVMILNALDRDAADGKAARGEMAAELRSAISEQQSAECTLNADCEQVTEVEAPSHSLPNWNECNLRVGNSKWLKDTDREAEHDSLTANPLHEFIYEYDDSDAYKSAWFLHRLEKLIDFVRSEQQPAPIFGDEDHVSIPRRMIAAACSAIDKKRDAENVLSELRRYTLGDLSRQTEPDVSALVEALEWLRGAINCTPENDKHKRGTWISTNHPGIKQIDEILAANRKDESHETTI